MSNKTQRNKTIIAQVNLLTDELLYIVSMRGDDQVKSFTGFTEALDYFNTL